MTKPGVLLFSPFLVIFLIFSSAVQAESPSPKPPPTISYKDLQSLGNALSLIEQLDLNNRESRTFLYAALAGMIEAFDRHSYFVPPDMTSLFLDSLKSEYVGIGIHIARTQDRNVEVVSVDGGSSADKAGILPKDVITTMDNIPLKAMNSTDVIRLIRGPDMKEGTEIRIAVRKAGSQEERELLLKRERIKIKTVESHPLRNSVGYVKVNRFTKDTPSDLKEIITALRKKNQIGKGLVLDLRNNPGGDIFSSIDVVRMFVDKGVVASTESNYPDLNVAFKAEGLSLIKEPLVVLVNEGTASSAELVAGAIKFHRRGNLIGLTTFGKGTFQSFVPITNEMGAYMTLGKFKLPNGISPEGNGIIPDITIKQASYDDSIIEEALNLLTKPAKGE